MELRRTRTAVALFLLCLVGAACTQAAGSAKETASTRPVNNTLVLEDGGTVTVALSHLPSEFNPSAPSGANKVTQMVMQQVWPQLFVGGRLSVQPNNGLLLSAEVVSLSPQTIVYKIDPRARWSDGVPITAADFVYDWHEQVAYGASLPATEPFAGYLDISSISSSGDGKTVTVTFVTPYADWQALFNNLVPSHVASRFGWTQAFARFDPKKIVSGGPFELSSLIPGKELVLRRNPNYWGQRPHLSEIVFRVEPNDAATFAALQSGQVDVAELSPSSALQARLDANIDLRSSTAPSPLLWQIDFNLADPALSTLALRQGLAAAIDRRQLIANTVGLLTPYDALVDNRLYLYAAPGGSGNAGSYDSPDLTEAQALFSAAGYHLDTDGELVSASGAPLTLTLAGPAGDSVVAAVEQQLQAQLLQVGVVLHVQNVPLRQLLSGVLPAGNYELALAPYAASMFPSTTAALYTDPVGPTPVPSAPVVPAVTHDAFGDRLALGVEPGAARSGSVTRDVMGLDDPRLVSLFAAASAELNATSQAGLYNEIDTQLWSSLPTLPLFQQPVTFVSRVDIFDIGETGTWAGPMANAQDWAIQLNPSPITSTTTGS